MCLDTSKPESDWLFIAEVKGYDESKKCIVLEQRGRFKKRRRTGSPFARRKLS
ncbi:MAG: U32 family peptidase C-terminal domain-containing protein [Clostridiales bacterium]|nr:MAG: U32 family peptidase C-terminal domain-containing protein [Clostridiales bacterium]